MFDLFGSSRLASGRVHSLANEEGDCGSWQSGQSTSAGNGETLAQSSRLAWAGRG
jgi:hypothetical protein